MDTFSRRRVLGSGALLGAAALGTAVTARAEAATEKAGSAAASGSRTGAGARAREETKSLDELYADARREGGELVIYAGGDTPDQDDATKQAFVKQFPDIRLTMVVDYSKYHDVRTDVTPAGGLKPIWDYPNANLDGFPRFMADRAGAERWRQTFTLYFGEVHGAPTPGWLGLHPGR